jgi:DNA phosphorothioation-dependent restriction protein DptG
MVKIDDDLHAWLLDQASALRERRYFSLDWEHLAEELEAIAARDRREVKDRLKNLLLHLLKFNFQPDQAHRHHSWRSSVREAREQISDILEDAPGIFQGKRDEVLAMAYSRARDKASDESGLPLSIFPTDCPWSFDRIMQPDFFPGE